MKVLVTGGAGFIGSHIANYHHQKGDQVWVIDDLSTGDESYLDPFIYRFSRADMRKYPLRESFDWADRVYHMAATVGQARVLADPEGAFLNNCQCCEALFASAQPHNQIFIASSASVYWYGVVGDQILKEDSVLKIPSGASRQQAYGLSKLFGENLAQLSKRHVIIGRLFNIFGPRQKSAYGAVIPRWLEQLQKNVPLTVYGNGDQIRSFCYVDDAVEAIDLLFQKSPGGGEIYNIGSERSVSLIELSEIIKRETSKGSKIINVPYKKAYGFDFDEAENILPSFEKIRNMGFRAKISLEEGISRIAKQ